MPSRSVMAPGRLRILVPIDFSEPSLRSLDHALALALRSACEIHLLHVVEGAFDGAAAAELAHDFTELERVAQAELHRLVTSNHAGDRVVFERHVAAGRPADAILAASERLRIDLVVMGSRGRGGLGARLLGSVAEEVIHRSACPVLCARPDGRPAEAGVPPQDRIVCPVDFSRCSRLAMLAAARLARHLEVELVLLHVEEAAPPPGGEPAEIGSLTTWKRELEEEAGVKAMTALVRGRPGPEILRFVREDRDLLVVGTHGKTGLRRLLMGSVADTVVRGARCLVLTVRPPSEEADRRAGVMIW